MSHRLRDVVPCLGVLAAALFTDVCLLKGVGKLFSLLLHWVVCLDIRFLVPLGFVHCSVSLEVNVAFRNRESPDQPQCGARTKQQEGNGGCAEGGVLFRSRAMMRSPKSIGRWAIPRVSKLPSYITRRSMRCARKKTPLKRLWWHHAFWEIVIARREKSRRQNNSTTAPLDCCVRSAITSPISTRSTPVVRQVRDIQGMT